MDKDHGQDVREFARRLRTAGVHGALGFLNSRTRHRYTGAYAFDGDRLVCLCLFDRENPTTRAAASVLLKDTYCGIIADSHTYLEIEDALHDERVAAHAAREAVLAYQGVSLRSRPGLKPFGTLCHWDTRPRLISPDERTFLFRVAPLIARHLDGDSRSRRGAPSGRRPSQAL